MSVLLTPYDNRLTGNELKLQMADGTAIEFQFPPRIPSANRKGTWKEGELQGTEPIAEFATSGAREITLTWVYLILGGEWPVVRVQKNVRALRAYFALLRDLKNREALVILAKFWGLGGKDPMSFRITDINIKHGETIVGEPAEAFHFRTDVTLELKAWTKGSEEEPEQNVSKMLPILPEDWY